MGAAVNTPALRKLVERLAHHYRLGISRYFQEEDLGGWYAAAPEAKRDTLLRLAGAVEGGPVRLLVFHIGLVTPEMDALADMNSFGPKEMSRHRQAELRALTSPEFRKLLNDRGVRFETYGRLISERALESMTAPADE